MNLFQTIRSLQTIAGSNPYINNVGDGSIYQFLDANPSIKYGVFFVTQTTHRENELFDWYGFNLFVVDRLIDDLESNRLQIQSIAKDVLSNTIKTFCTKFYGVTHNEIRYVPFTQRFSDLCAGQYCTVELRIPKSIICEEDFEDLIVFTGDCQECYNEGYAQGLSQTYEDGFESGRTYQKSLLVATQFTENGTYAREDGYSVITVNVDVEKYYNSGWTEGYQSGNTDGYDNGYQSGVTDQKNKLESITITDNGTYSREDGYSQIVVDVECISGDCSEAYESGWSVGYVSGNTDGYEEGYADGLADCSGSSYEEGYSDGFEDGYQSGYTDGINACDDRYEEGYESGKTDGYESGYTGGYNSGKTDGIDYQKSLLVNTAITVNGTYATENGYGQVVVDIPQSGYTEEDLLNYYQSGKTDGIDYQKSLLEGIYITDNGQYNKVNGYSSVTVNINTQAYYDSGYTSGVTDGYQSGYTGGYDSGKTEGYESGITYQKSLLTGTAFTENGTYTSPENGWSAVTINVPQSGYTEQDLINAFNSGYSEGYDAGLAACESGSTDYSTEYLSFEAQSAGTLYWKAESSAFTRTIEYSKNGGTWTSVTSNENGSGATICEVVAGDKVRFRGNNVAYCSGAYNQGENASIFQSNCNYNVYGNIMSLIYGDNFINQYELVSGHTFCEIFKNSTTLIDASNLILPATALTESCYLHMFIGCSSLINAPALPATTLAEDCYREMFWGCSELTNAPELPATTLTESCYRNMFRGCASLTSAPELPATTLVNSCYRDMFVSCTSLTSAPELPATTLVQGCYSNMFSGCRSLNNIKCLATDISAYGCTSNWLYGTSSTGTFVKNPDMTGWGRGTSGIPTNWTIEDA